jgi:hypothetical protein
MHRRRRSTRRKDRAEHSHLRIPVPYYDSRRAVNRQEATNLPTFPAGVDNQAYIDEIIAAMVADGWSDGAPSGKKPHGRPSMSRGNGRRHGRIAAT